MRRIMALGACFGAALATAACNLITMDQRYVREGAGADIYWSGLADATYLQELYVGYICQQAGLPVLVEGDMLRCSDAAFGPRDWGIFVQAGMNDIDKRCDAYLAWMDEKKRSSGPLIQEIVDIHAATSAIFLATGVGAVPMGIVTAAFGLATNTLTNLNHRLILELEKTTVQAVVFNGRNTYRINLAKVTIDNRPAAIHAVQSYLEICTPISIEANVNQTITVFERGGPAAAQALANNRLNTTKTVAAASLMPRQQIGMQDRRSLPVNSQKYAEILQGDTRASDLTVEHALLAICVRREELGSVSRKTKALIDVFETEFHGPNQAGVNGKLDKIELDSLSAESVCQTGIFEKIKYGDPNEGPAATARLITFLRSQPEGANLPANATLQDPATRRAIAMIKMRLGLKDDLPDQVTPALSRCVERGGCSR